jgi:hypothetical protein
VPGVVSASIVNSGTISVHQSGVFVHVSAFTGAISNSGTISAPSGGGAGIYLFRVSTFVGGISNAGKIAMYGADIQLQLISTFSGDIVNSGTIVGPAHSALRRQ